MTPIILLKELKKFIEEATKDIMLEVRPKTSKKYKPSHCNDDDDDDGLEEDEPLEIEETPEIDKTYRAVEVHLMRLKDKKSETKRVPYALLQFLTGTDEQLPGQQPESQCQIRIVVVVYSEDGGAGAIDVLNLLTCIRIELLKAGEIGRQFLLRKPLEYIVYPEDTGPYYMGEMITTWEMPEIYREGVWEGYGY